MSKESKKFAKVLTLPRKIAFDTLLQIEEKGAPLQAALDKNLSGIKATEKDKALATQLTYGVMRLNVRLNALLAEFLKSPHRLPRELLPLLRMAAYELLYLSKIPDYASIFTYVEGVKAKFGPTIGGLANAVLRKVAKLPLQSEAAHEEFFKGICASEKAFLSAWHSLPLWLVEHFLQNYSREDALAYIENSLGPAPVGVRINKTSEHYKEALSLLESDPACLIKRDSALAFLPGTVPEQAEAFFKQGILSYQSFAAQEAMYEVFNAAAAAAKIELALTIGPVWDACAGHGGKTCWMLESKLPVFAVSDVNTRRLARLKRDLARLHLQGPHIFAADARMPPFGERSPKPGIILLDAPCSGLGTLAHRPDIKLDRTAKNLTELACLQKEIIASAWDLLPADGILIYLTCTLNPQENEEQIKTLLAKNSIAQEVFNYTTPSSAPGKEFFWASVVQKKA